MQRLNSDSFSWIRWRNCDINKMFQCQCKEKQLTKNKRKLLKYAVGYCYGENLLCRPKRNHVAILFLKDNIYSWFHLTNKEAYNIFKIKR